MADWDSMSPKPSPSMLCTRKSRIRFLGSVVRDCSSTITSSTCVAAQDLCGNYNVHHDVINMCGCTRFVW
uniref:Uncharacterized protein n=1 Tax=Oryza brachyantha TaxID=4533 RepID=J3M5K4_ORYBR